MKKLFVFMLFFSLFIGISVVAVTTPESAFAATEMVFVDATSNGELSKLRSMGLDIGSIRKVTGPKGQPVYRFEIVANERDKKKLADQGFVWTKLPAPPAPKARTLAATTVYHSYDEPDLGIKDQLLKISQTYPAITHLEDIGLSHQGRQILAMRITGPQDDDDDDGYDDDDRRSEVLYLATHHAREWVATQMAMRLIKHFTTNYGSDAQVTRLVNTTEIWIIPVANPDGYEYTFTAGNRLWRKNLRDNDGDGIITDLDGVDLNRNFTSDWGLDDEGSSSSLSDGTYRGPSPASEPETQAVINFINKRDFKFTISYHTYGNWILYPWGWQKKTSSYDDPIFVSQAGTDDNPAITDSIRNEGYDPGPAADLYITNGDYGDWAYAVAGVPAYVVELTDGYGFVFPDDEQMVQTVFEDNLAFALALAESADTPTKPFSPVGIETKKMYHSPLAISYGANQAIDVLALKRMKRKMKLYYALNGGGYQKARFSEHLGQHYNTKPGVYFTNFRAVIPNQQEGDQVSYFIKAGREKLGPFSYTVGNASGNRILLVSAEDYTGSRPTYSDPTGPNYLQFYTDALDAGGFDYDIWDVTAMGATPDYMGVLTHYDVAIWYSGDDRAHELLPKFRAFEQLYMNFRSFINDGGRLFATGQDLAYLTLNYFPPEEKDRLSDDVFQYYLGAGLYLEKAGYDLGTNSPYNVVGIDGDPVFDGLSFEIQGGDGANNQLTPDAFVTNSFFLPAFPDKLAARYDRANIFIPKTGSFLLDSRQDNESYKRIGGTFSIPAGTPTLEFWTYFNIETDWDYAFVEIAESGTDFWTTLPDQTGFTSTNPGDSCEEGWIDAIHPFLYHYQSRDPDGTCTPTGTSGDWNALSGNSGGWQRLVFDLSAYAGSTVDLYITYASDWGTQGVGVFIDDLELSGYPFEGFETGLGDWTTSSAPGSPDPRNNWERDTGPNYPDGAATISPVSIYLGFGFEAVDTEQNRNTLMDNVMNYLLTAPVSSSAGTSADD